MATRRDKIHLNELRGQDRAFQLDRDTVLIYTGTHPSDIRPFARIGASPHMPVALLSQIENVILPEENLWNIGLEAAWMSASLASGAGRLRYVGSRERTQQIHRYFAKDEEEAREKDGPVDYQTYEAPRNEANLKDRCTITYMKTGDYTVTVGGSKVLDSGGFMRGKIDIDREYDLINRALLKREKRAEKGISFVPLGPGEQGVSLYWNFHGEGLLMNGPADIHYKLFLNAIDPENLSMAIASSPYNPGLVELLRRKNTTEGQAGVFCLDAEKLVQVKKMYQQAQVKIFDDSRTLPFSKDTVFFTSRTRSHAILAPKLRDEAEAPVQILFPLGGKKQSKAFDFTKGPFDLELLPLHNKGDLKDVSGSFLTLFQEGDIADNKFQSISLEPGAFPVVEDCEYVLAQAMDYAEVADALGHGLRGTVFEEPVRELFTLMSGSISKESIESIEGCLYIIRTQAVPDDIRTLINLGEAMRIAEPRLSALQQLNPKIPRLARDVAKRYSPSKLKVKDVLELQGHALFGVHFVAGKATMLQVDILEPEPVQIVLPPEVDYVKEQEKEYRKYLKAQNKVLDKGDEMPAYRAALELVEKLFEERLRIDMDRQRLADVLAELETPVTTSEESSDLPFYMKVPYWLRKVLEFLKIPELVALFKGEKDRGEAENRI